MSDNSIFLSLAKQFANGDLDGNLDSIFALAATDGYVILPGRKWTRAKCSSYGVDDLMLPVDLKTWGTITAAYKAGMDIFPDWFRYNPEKGYFEYSQDEFCRAFIKRKGLTRRNGDFLMNGNLVTTDTVKEAMRRSLAIVRQDAGSKLSGTFEALRAMCKDEQPPEKRQRLSIEALAAEIAQRGFDIRLNLVSRAFEVVGTTETGRNMQLDDLVMLLHNSLADTYKGVTFSNIEQYLVFIGREHSYNPILDLFSNTKHDGKSRIGQLYSLMGIEDDDLSKRLVLKWLLQSVALLFNDEADPFGADGVLVLNGEQGTGKTSLFRHLAIKRAWFGEGEVINERDKDTSRRAITVWISELGEVESTLKSDVESLKAFVSQSVDSYRLPYGRADVVGARHTSLCATCNSDRYLLDTTGNRRWWSVPFRRKVPREELLALDALQLWAEVYEHVSKLPYEQKAACFRLSADEQEALAKRNGTFEKPLKGQVEVEDILSKAKEDGLVFREMTITEFKDHWSALRSYSAQQIGVALKKVLGDDAGRRTKKARLYELPINMRVSEPFKEKALSP